jgi:tRNA G18 (ribose-2'-O)-methylase SpoU
MGSLFRLPSAVEDAPALATRLRRAGIAAIGADPAGTALYDESDLERAVAVFFGGEGQGLPADLLPLLDGTLRVPLAPHVDSLSVGAAAAVVLFEAARRRRGATRGT